MAPEPRREVLGELLGAYALDALDDTEREQVERYLETDPRGRAQVVEFRETAAMLAHSGTDAPAGLWDRIADAMEEEPPYLEVPDPIVTRMPAGRGRNESPKRSVGARWVGVAAAVAATLIAVLAVEVVRQNDRLDRLDTALRRDAFATEADRARSAAGSRTVGLDGADGRELASVIVRSDGAGYFVAEGMPRAPSGDTYQLWALVGDPDAPTAISAGVLGRDPRVAPFRFDGPVVGFAVTRERAPGVVSSQRSPVLQGRLSAS